MLWDASAINGYEIVASDGRLGTVSDFIFDDIEWKIHAVVVETGEWLAGRKVTLPVSVLGQPDPSERCFPVKLTMQQIKDSPEFVEPQPKNGEEHLRGITAVSRSHVHAVDGEIGHVETLLIDDSDWTIRYITVHTANWLPGEKVLISPRSVQLLDLEHGHIHVDVTREKVKDSPRYEPTDTVDGAFDEKFLTYYGIKWIEQENVKPAPTATSSLRSPSP
jgi:PRC-barrel domain